jgi:polyisoprenoid-binding protein YceI
MIKKLTLTALMAAFVVVAPLHIHAAEMTPVADMPAGKYTLDKAHASLTWKVNHLGLSNYTARFTDIDATINFDPKDLTKSTLIATVDPASVKTDYPDAKKKNFDAKLAEGKEWFNAKQFPNITFKSTKIEKTSETTGKIYGELTFLGVTKPLVLDATFNGAYAKKTFAPNDAAGLGFSATGVVKRSLWGLGTYVPVVGDDVTVQIETEFHKAQ